MRAGRFALAHYINLLSCYKNALSTFGSKITPYISVVFVDMNSVKFAYSVIIKDRIYIRFAENQYQYHLSLIHCSLLVQ